jgi:hypothetical protein
MERRGRKGSASARSEMERAGDRKKWQDVDRPKPTGGCTATGRKEDVFSGTRSSFYVGNKKHCVCEHLKCHVEGLFFWVGSGRFRVTTEWYFMLQQLFFHIPALLMKLCDMSDYIHCDK